MKKIKKRCAWVDPKNEMYINYHDNEWGRPVKDDQTLFEFLILEGAQAGLNWSTILKKRENYRQLFAQFQVEKVSRLKNKDIERLMKNDGIIRNRLKINSAIGNAKAFIEIQKEFGSFSRFLWSYVNDRPIRNHYRDIKEIPSQTPLSKQISKDLKRRGFNFVGPTIIYAYMQAVGLVNDHTSECFLYDKNIKQKKTSTL